MLLLIYLKFLSWASDLCECYYFLGGFMWIACWSAYGNSQCQHKFESEPFTLYYRHVMLLVLSLRCRRWIRLSSSLPFLRPGKMNYLCVYLVMIRASLGYMNSLWNNLSSVLAWEDNLIYLNWTNFHFFYFLTSFFFFFQLKSFQWLRSSIFCFVRFWLATL